MGRWGHSWLTATLVVAMPRLLLAQAAVEPYLTIGGGKATDAFGVRSAAVAVAPGVTLRQSTALTFTVAGDYTRFTGDQWSLGGNGAFAARAPLVGPVGLSATGSAAVTQTGYRARYTHGELVPSVDLVQGPVTVFAGARLARGGMRVEEATPARPIPIGTPAASVVTSTTSLRTTVYGAVVRLAGTQGRGTLTVREERGQVGDSALVDRSIVAGLDAGRVSLWGSVGTRRLDEFPERYTSGGASVTVRPGLAVQVGVGRYAANPLTRAAGGSYASVGVALTRRAAQSPERAPRVTLRGEAPPRAGMTRMAIRAPAARTVELAGDWSSWKLVPARRAADGVHWYVDLPIAPGRYRYAFRIDGQRWEVPPGSRAVDDGFGGKSAWLTIE